jgi:GMP synthase (glutamine-hydrolysing)
MNKMKFMIVDGYPKESRDQFDVVGMRLAAQLYADMVKRFLPEAECEIYYTSDPGVALPGDAEMAKAAGLLWPGCNLTVYHDQDERVTKMLNGVKQAYRLGVPQFGSCWGAQIAVVAAGGKVAPNPKGREMGLARKIHLTDEGRKHPMYAGKPAVFEGYISHDDHIVELPAGAVLLASNEFSRVQAVAVQHEKGVFWATQYHPEYDLHEVARLIVAREERLIHHGFFKDREDLSRYVQDLETLYAHPDRKDLRWKYAIDDHVLDEAIRQKEFSNWLDTVVKPRFEKIS